MISPIQSIRFKVNIRACNLRWSVLHSHRLSSIYLWFEEKNMGVVSIQSCRSWCCWRVTMTLPPTKTIFVPSILSLLIAFVNVIVGSDALTSHIWMQHPFCIVSSFVVLSIGTQSHAFKEHCDILHEQLWLCSIRKWRPRERMCNRIVLSLLSCKVVGRSGEFTKWACHNPPNPPPWGKHGDYSKTNIHWRLANPLCPWHKHSSWYCQSKRAIGKHIDCMMDLTNRS